MINRKCGMNEFSPNLSETITLYKYHARYIYKKYMIYIYIYIYMYKYNLR